VLCGLSLEQAHSSIVNSIKQGAEEAEAALAAVIYAYNNIQGCPCTAQNQINVTLALTEAGEVLRSTPGRDVLAAWHQGNLQRSWT
jgi:hypothetical protein